MKKYTIATGASVLVSAASVFVFYGLESGYHSCARLVREPANIRLLKDEVQRYRDSGAWDEAIFCTVKKAKQILQTYKPKPYERPAIVFDIDDTALSNWEFLLASDFAYIHNEYTKWENSAKDPAIEPIKNLYDEALLKGFAIFFITGRREVQRKPTEFNLEAAGFTQWNGVFFKPMDFTGKSVAEFKSKWRAYIEDLGYTIVINIGDQQSDLDGKPQAIHNFKIPNPAYFIP